MGSILCEGFPVEAVKRQTKILGTNYKAGDIVEMNNVCDWNKSMAGINMTHPAGHAYYQSMVDLFDEWGIDYRQSG